MKRNVWMLGALLALACNPFGETEPTTTDPVIRARELNDSAIDLVSKDIRYADYAIAVFDDAIALDSTYDKPLINKLGLQLQLERYEAALETAEKLRVLNWVRGDVLACTGMIYRILGDTANMTEYLYASSKSYQQELSNLDTAGPVYRTTATELALVYLLLDKREESEKWAKGMGSEELPDDRRIAAEFWKSIQPE